LQHDFFKDEISGAGDEDEEGEEEQDDGDENDNENGLIEQCREMEQTQNQRVSKHTYQTMGDQTGNLFTSYYAAPPSASTESCYAKDYVPSTESAGGRPARTHRGPAEKLDESKNVRLAESSALANFDRISSTQVKRVQIWSRFQGPLD